MKFRSTYAYQKTDFSDEDKEQINHHDREIERMKRAVWGMRKQMAQMSRLLEERSSWSSKEVEQRNQSLLQELTVTTSDDDNDSQDGVIDISSDDDNLDVLQAGPSSSTMAITRGPSFPELLLSCEESEANHIMIPLEKLESHPLTVKISRFL